MDPLGGFLAIIIGIIFGLIGTGGSILTIPLLYYFFKIPPLLATSYSLILIGLTSFLGSLLHHKNKNINYKLGLYFSAVSVVSVFLTRSYLLPIVPENIFNYKSIIITKEYGVLILLSTIMMISGYLIVSDRTKKNHVDPVLAPEHKISMTSYGFIASAFIVGIITGLVGTGGSFLIIPTLMFFSKLQIKKAIGTSILIVCVNSLFGFLSDFKSGIDFNFSFILPFLICICIGMAVGMQMAKKLSNNHLKYLFGYVTLIVGIFIMLESIYASIILN